MNKVIFVARMDDSWDLDYLKAFETIEGFVDELFKQMEFEGFYTTLTKKEIVENMKYRAKRDWVELIGIDDDKRTIGRFKELTGYLVRKVEIRE